MFLIGSNRAIGETDLAEEGDVLLGRGLGAENFDDAAAGAFDFGLNHLSVVRFTFFFKPQNRGKKIKIKKMTAGEFVWHAPVFVFTKKNELSFSIALSLVAKLFSRVLFFIW